MQLFYNEEVPFTVAIVYKVLGKKKEKLSKIRKKKNL